jgi:hypothetical protein
MRNCVLALMLVFAACEEPVRFAESQPIGQPQLERFPKRWQGTYALKEDSSLLEIGPKVIQLTNEWELRISMTDLDSSTRLTSDTVLVLGDGSRFPVSIRNDSVFGTLSYTDTLFAIGDRQVLKGMGGSLFLNSLDNAAGWEVTQVSLSKSRLRFSEITDPESLSAINEVLELPGDTLSTALVVSRKQFRGLIRRGGFAFSKEYVRVKKQ